MSCTFCKILNRELPASIIHEDANILAFLDIHPVNPGHTLIVPKRHVESYVDLTKEEASQMAIVAQLIAEKLKQNIKGCDGVNLSLADGEVAGQEVPHAHLHVIQGKS